MIDNPESEHSAGASSGEADGAGASAGASAGEADDAGASSGASESQARLWYLGLENTVRLLKHMIGECGQTSWEAAKATTNDYELVYTSPPCVFAGVDATTGAAVRRPPVGRAFFKLWELLWEAPLIDTPRPIRCAYVGEAPGSFIESVVTMRRERGGSASSPEDRHWGMSLAGRPKGGGSVPGWKLPAAWCSSNGVTLCHGEDGTGDLYKRGNVDSFLRTVGAGSCDLFTADGGFDFSCNFERQEEDMIPLLRAEFATALMALREGGTAVVKVFDAYRAQTIALLEAFSTRFSSSELVKPVTSRPANSERYLVCAGYLGPSPGGAGLAEAMLEGSAGETFVREAAAPARGRFCPTHLAHAIRQVDSIVRTLAVSDSRQRGDSSESGYRKYSPGHGGGSGNRRSAARPHEPDQAARRTAGVNQEEVARGWWRSYSLPG